MRNVAIIGAGVVGTAIGYLLNKRGYHITGIASRTIDSARRARDFIGSGTVSTDLCSTARKADIVFITTSDGAIRGVCNKIAAGKGFKRGSIVFHACGALSSKVLLSAKKKGAYTASLHPLQSLASVKEAVRRIPGSYFSIEGDEAALSAARDIVASLRGREIELRIQKKTLYHAGACAVSNYLVATIGLGLELFEAAGIGREDSLKALMPLINGTVKNIRRLGIPKALTGPIARGDAGIIREHLKSISRDRRDLVDLYCELGRYTVKTGIAKGTLDAKNALAIDALFDNYQKGKDI
ncbi:MAG TPA: DUF2520 domain-containing protein [Thermodesulfovibrionales bacterium]|nr:DUF2520 domain-containing protein [Thermodesulfovibrionales bacterium]